MQNGEQPTHQEEQDLGWTERRDPRVQRWTRCDRAERDLRQRDGRRLDQDRLQPVTTSQQDPRRTRRRHLHLQRRQRSDAHLLHLLWLISIAGLGFGFGLGL